MVISSKQIPRTPEAPVQYENAPHALGIEKGDEITEQVVVAAENEYVWRQGLHQAGLLEKINVSKSKVRLETIEKEWVGETFGRNDDDPLTLGVIHQFMGEINEKLDHMNGRLDHMNGRLDHMNGRLDHMNGRLDPMDGKLDHMNGRLDHMNGRLDHMNGRLDPMDGKLDHMGGKLDIITKEMNAKRYNLALSQDTFSIRPLPKTEAGIGSNLPNFHGFHPAVPESAVGNLPPAEIGFPVNIAAIADMNLTKINRIAVWYNETFGIDEMDTDISSRRKFADALKI